MNIEELRLLCTSFPSVTEDIKWDNHLWFKIGGKMFFIAGLDQTPMSVSFKVDEEDFARLSIRDGFKPAPYLARYNWIHTSDVGHLNKAEWKELIKKSYDLIRSKLPKKLLSTLK